MASLTLKNIPNPLLVQLRASAKDHRRSLNQEAIVLLESALRKPDGEAIQLLRTSAEAQVRIWKRLSAQWRSNTTVKEDIASIHRARTKGRKGRL